MGQADRIEPVFAPRWYQVEVYKDLDRFNVLVMHRRSGKTVMSINVLIYKILECKQKDARGAYLSPLYSQSKRVAWDYVREFTQHIPGCRFNESELRVDFPGGQRIQLFGADNPDALRGMYFDFVVLDEVAQMSPRAWTEVLRPALADRQGGAIFIGTPRGKQNLFHELYDQATSKDGWYRCLMKVEDTNALDEGEIETMRREMSEDEFEQELNCSFTAAIKGAVYGNELNLMRQQDRVTVIGWEPQLPVFTSWDLGLADATSIWYAQMHYNELRLIDYDEFTNVNLIDIIKHVREKPYIYQDHYAPHDIKVRELTSGRSRLDIAADAGIRFIPTRIGKREDGIEAVRVMLRRTWIDEEQCSRGLGALENYRYEYNDKTGVFRREPLHDWSSHAADALRYMAMNFDLMTRTRYGRYHKPKVLRSLNL